MPVRRARGEVGLDPFEEIGEKLGPVLADHRVSRGLEKADSVEVLWPDGKTSATRTSRPSRFS